MVSAATRHSLTGCGTVPASFSPDFPRHIAFDTSPVCRYSPPLTRRPVGNPGKDGNVASGQRVLVVDESSDTAEVLKAVLEPRGMRVDRAFRAVGSGAHHPSAPPAGLSLVVLDEESIASGAVDPQGWGDVPRIIIGRISIPSPQSPGKGAPERHLQKPFHYAELVRAIDSLIDAAPEPAAGRFQK